MISTAPWPTIIASGVALLLVTVLGAGLRAILKGDLVPRAVLEDAKGRADKWEQAWEKSEARLDLFEQRLDAITAGTELNSQLLSELVSRARI